MKSVTYRMVAESVYIREGIFDKVKGVFQKKPATGQAPAAPKPAPASAAAPKPGGFANKLKQAGSAIKSASGYNDIKQGRQTGNKQQMMSGAKKAALTAAGVGAVAYGIHKVRQARAAKKAAKEQANAAAAKK